MVILEVRQLLPAGVIRKAAGRLDSLGHTLKSGWIWPWRLKRTASLSCSVQCSSSAKSLPLVLGTRGIQKIGNTVPILGGLIPWWWLSGNPGDTAHGGRQYRCDQSSGRWEFPVGGSCPGTLHRAGRVWTQPWRISRIYLAGIYLETFWVHLLPYQTFVSLKHTHTLQIAFLKAI